MEQITITREQFREKILRNPRAYGIVRAKRENPEKYTGIGTLQLLIEETMQAIMIREIEEDLFGDEPEEKKDPVKDALEINLTLFKED